LGKGMAQFAARVAELKSPGEHQGQGRSGNDAELA
jgi:hypothetical protein